jgi:hypothetical protein
MRLLTRLLLVSLAVPFLAFGHDQSSTPLTRAEAHMSLFGLPKAGPADSVIVSLDSPLAPVEGRKSPGLAVIYSLLLPGMGEWYADDMKSGKYFLIGEGVLWLTYAAFEISGNELRNASRAYAVSHAGVNAAGKDDQYYIDIGNFLSLDDYNAKKLRDRDITRLYDPAAGFSWQWDTDAARASYRSDRVRSETMYNGRKFIGAVILVNHIASAINAARAAISHNSALGAALKDVSFGARLTGPLGRPDGMEVTISRTF